MLLLSLCSRAPRVLPQLAPLWTTIQLAAGRRLVLLAPLSPPQMVSPPHIGVCDVHAHSGLSVADRRRGHLTVFLPSGQVTPLATGPTMAATHPPARVCRPSHSARPARCRRSRQPRCWAPQQPAKSSGDCLPTLLRVLHCTDMAWGASSCTCQSLLGCILPWLPTF